MPTAGGEGGVHKPSAQASSLHGCVDIEAAKPLIPRPNLDLGKLHVAELHVADKSAALFGDEVHAGIEMQQAHMVEPVPAAPHVDRRVSVDGGEITVRLTGPMSRGAVGCHLYVHGGGWWMGTLDQSDLACSRIVNEVGCAVASVEKTRRIRAYMDSELVVDQVNGVSAVREPDLIKLQTVASSLVALFENRRICWVPREWNAEADQLVRDALGALD